MKNDTSVEKDVWAGNPSQVINLKVYLLCALTCWLIIPIFIALWSWLSVKYTRFELTSERLRERTGVLNKKLDVLELYRVKDLHVEQPLFLRLFGLGNVVLITSDRTHPTVTLTAIPQAEDLSNELRELVETMRRSRGVREFD